jgi:hypothetical protein
MHTGFISTAITFSPPEAPSVVDIYVTIFVNVNLGYKFWSAVVSSSNSNRDDADQGCPVRRQPDHQASVHVNGNIHPLSFPKNDCPLKFKCYLQTLLSKSKFCSSE